MTEREYNWIDDEYTETPTTAQQKPSKKPLQKRVNLIENKPGYEDRVVINLVRNLKIAQKPENK